MGRIGRALATGYGFSDPFTATPAPPHGTPRSIRCSSAGVFKVFGVYTQLSAWVLLTINSVFSAATAPAIVEIARRCFAHLPEPTSSERRAGHTTATSIALWSGWLWALYPAAMQYAVRWIWDMTLTAFVLTCIFVIALRVRGIGDPEPPAPPPPYGPPSECSGASSLSPTPHCSSILPVTGIWMLGGTKWRSRLAPNLAGAVLSAVLCAAVIAPWIARNYHVFHTFVPFRDNFPAEFDESLKEEHMGFPWGNPLTLNTLNVKRPEFRRYIALGEFEYLRQRSEHAKAKSSPTATTSSCA